MNLRALVRPLAIGLLAVVVLGFIASLAARPIAASRARAAARARGLELRWKRFDLRWPARAALEDLVVLRLAGGDTVLTAGAAAVVLRAFPLLLGRAHADLVALDSVRVRLPGAREAEADTLLPPDERGGGAVALQVRQRADAVVRTLLAPARELPELRLHDLEVTRGDDRFLTLAALDLDHEESAANLALNGTYHGEDEVPFDVLLRWQHDDRITGRVQFNVPDADNPRARPLVLTLDGRVSQDRRAREVRVAPGTAVRIGDAPARVEGLVSAAGPRFKFSIALDGLDEKIVQRSVPAALLGPLAGLEVLGTWDWHADFDLDLAKPDSVHFHADVIPHGLALDHALSRPSPAALAAPFTAQIHLPRGRVVKRELSAVNPHFRPLARISPWLRDALVTNEDGGFWRHRGFNTEAIGLAIAANLRAGSYKRGAGTITMQLARNLWLGHRRTLARKGQEVVMAWVVEHLSGLSKERMLEIYLNVIEWGPDVHGADEAARYYFGTDAASLSLEEALFLTIIVPSPARWRWRFTPDGTLRPYAREQMHYIANKMASKGWLGMALVPPADSIRVTLRGPARALFAAPDSVATTPAPFGTGP